MPKKRFLKMWPCLAFLFMTILPGCSQVVNAHSVEANPPVSQNESSSSVKDYSRLLSVAQTAGSIRILVKLNMPFVPDGQLSPKQAEEQQVRISEMQDRLCSVLVQQDVQGIKRFKYTPYMAMRVNTAALKVLISSPLVSSIEADDAVPPAER
jgi:hypothetical protein